MPAPIIPPAISPDGIPNAISQPPAPQPVVAPVVEPVAPTPAPVAPVEPPVTPPVEKPEDTNIVSLDDFLAVTGKEKQSATPPVDDKAKPVVEPPKTDDDIVPISKPPVDNKDKNWRDVSTIDDKELSALLVKDVSKKAFEKLKPIVEEHKKFKADLDTKQRELTLTQSQLAELKQNGPQLPENYYEHTDGYLLDPQFKTEAGHLSDAQLILNHWQKQAIDVAAGATEIEILSLNPKSQQYEITGKVPADRANEIKLNGFINYAQNAVNNQTVKVQGMVQSFQGRSRENVQSLNGVRSQLFSKFYATPENKAIYEPAVRAKLEIIPPAFRNSPVAVFAAEALVWAEVVSKLLIDAQSKQPVAPATNGQPPPVVPKPNGGPSGAEAAGDGDAPKSKGVKDEDISFDDFKKVKEGVV